MEQDGQAWENWIVVDPRVHGGCPVVRGTRMPVETIVGSLAGGMSVEAVCDEYRLSEEQVRAAQDQGAGAVAGTTGASGRGSRGRSHDQHEAR